MRKSWFSCMVVLLLVFLGCGRSEEDTSPKPRADVPGTWEYVSGESIIRLTFSQDGSVTWTRDDSRATLLPTWLFYGKWKTAEGKLTVYGKFHGEDKSQEWTYSLEEGGSKLRLVEADGSATTMSRIGTAQ